MKNIKTVQEELNKHDIQSELGSKSGWSENSLIFQADDCQILLYVDTDEKNNLNLSYYDLFPKGEYSEIHDEYMEETMTSYRGSSSSVEEMLDEVCVW